MRGGLIWRDLGRRERFLLLYVKQLTTSVDWYHVRTISHPDGFKEHPPSLPQTPVHRAASLVRAVMAFREQYKLGQVPPEATKEGPICMDTWRYVSLLRIV